MEEKRARDSSSSSFSSNDESLCYYAPHWKRGNFSFPSGSGPVGSMGTAFTRAQWLELQRQAMIYKHITASVPVPPYLLVPFHYSNAPYCMIGGARGGLVNFGYLVNNSDPEPRRCRRTDGKKWRCSKDAAPDQKYCERHLHRGKPRSRKLVEGPKSKTPGSVAAVHCGNSVSVAPPIPMVKGGVHNSSWNNCMGSSGSFGLFGYEEDKSSSLLKHGNTRITEAISDGDHTGKQWCHHGSHSFPSLNSDLSAISERTASVPDASIERGGYIDAWSAEKAAATLNSTNNLASLDLQHCGLSLSMSNDRTDLGTADDPFAAMQSPVRWTNHESSLCGPLGEFFQPHQQLHIDVTEEPRAPAMLIDESNDQISPEQSPTRRFAWSPTGVLQKTFSSHSDNSNASSPSFVGMGSTSAIYYQQHVLPDFK